MPAELIVIGDKVKMDVTNSPTMLVGEIAGQDAKCWYWDNEEKKFNVWPLPLICLKKV